MSVAIVEQHTSHLSEVTFLLVLIACVCVAVPGDCFASDEGGCVTCHQYPGIAKLMPSGEFKVLHIDEQIQLESVHGEFDCRQCHTQINQTPHIDTVVDCTTECHAKDREEIDAMNLSSFHEGEQTAIKQIEHRSSCAVCHPVYPHGQNVKVRAIFNMHSAHITCEVCHLKLEEYADPSYDWGPAEKVDFLGKPFANYAVEETVQGVNRYTLSRIAVYAVSRDKREELVHSEDVASAVAFNSKVEEMTAPEKQHELDYFHREIVRKEITVACNECHRENGRLDFRKLGFDEQRTRTLQHLNIKGWATRYDTFFFPKLF